MMKFTEYHDIVKNHNPTDSETLSKYLSPLPLTLEAIVWTSQKYLIKSVPTGFQRNYQKIGLKMTYRCFQKMMVLDPDSNLLADLDSQDEGLDEVD